jgi:iron complex outermembrane receptor protein
MTAQNHRMANGGQQVSDSTDVFYRHLQLNEVMVTGVTGDTKLKHSTAPISVVTGKELRQTTSTNVIDAVAKQPGMAQISTGGGISKPVIRGLGYNRIIVMNEGVRQEGQQWGDEHGVEVDGQNVGSVEILKGPASLMYGSDAMAGVLILHGTPSPLEGEVRVNVSTEYQTNNGLFAYSLNGAGNHGGFVWDARFSDKMAHAYKNKYDGYVPGSQFRERAGRLMLGLEKRWGQSHLTWTCYHLTPSIVEGERDEETGALERSEGFGVKTYKKTLPFQQVKHYKAVWDNSFNFSAGILKAIVGYQQNRRQEYEESADEYELFFKLHTVTYDVRYLTHEFDGWKLAVGVNGMWQQSKNLGEESLIPAYRLFDIGGYATTSKSIGSWTLNGGLRYDHRHLDFHSRDFSGVTGSVGAVWNATEQLNVRMNVARGFRAPNMSELGSDGVHEGTVRYEQGNAHLDAEYSWQADLGVDFESRHVSAQAALFANRIENYIFAKRVNVVMEEGYNTYEYTQGDARLLGFEVGVDVHPIHRLHFGNTFSYVNARQLNQPEETRHLPFTPAPRWTSEVKYELTHHGKVLNNAYVALGLECFLRQNHYYKADQTETATPSYTLLNLSAGSDLIIGKKKVAEMYLTAENLFNRAYQSHLSRLKYTDINNATGRMGVYNMGRNVVMKVVVPIEIRSRM